MRKLHLAIVVLAILVALPGIALISLPRREGTTATVEKHNPQDGGAATMTEKYNPDELYEELKSHPRRVPTVPPFFLKAFAIERLKEMANVKELNLLYVGEERPETFQILYIAEDKHLSVAVSVIHSNSGFSREEIVNREKAYVAWKQNPHIRTSEVTLVPVGDFGYLEVWKHTPENIPPNMPPELRAPLLVERADLRFIKGKVWLSLITWNGFLKPEQLLEIARGFEQLLDE